MLRRRSIGTRTTPAFVLPGESLSKYGGAPAPDGSEVRHEKPAAPRRPASTSKPSTLVDAPLAWDGSGLLPGESLSRHRRQAESPDEAEPQPANDASTPIRKPGSSGRRSSRRLRSGRRPHFTRSETTEEERPDTEFEEDYFLSHSGQSDEEKAPSTLERVRSNSEGDLDLEESDFTADSETASAEEDLTVHERNITILRRGSRTRLPPTTLILPAPTGFRLFGFGGKKKTEGRAARHR